MSGKYIGAEFELVHEYTNSLEQIFKTVDVREYTWYSTCSESYAEGDQKVDFFLPNGVYDGDLFEKLISSTDHFIHLLCLYGVPNGSLFSVEQVGDYDDFVKSNAEIALVSADSIVQVYIKDAKMLEDIAAICVDAENTFIDRSRVPFRLLTRETDTRTGFEV